MTLLQCVQMKRARLILGKSDAKGTFITEWNTKYVPAIISYGEKSRKGAITSVVTSMKPTGKLSTFSPECLCLHSDLYRLNFTSAYSSESSIKVLWL